MKVVYGGIAAIVFGLTAILTTAYIVAPSTPEPTNSSVAGEQAAASAIETEIAAADDEEPTRSPFVESLSVPDLLSYPVHGIAKRASITTLLTETGIQIGAPVTIDVDEARRLGVDFDRVIWFEAPREAGGSRLRALISLADPQRRLHAAVITDRRLQIGFHITTTESAEKLALMIVPRRMLELNEDLGLELQKVESPPSEPRPKITTAVSTTSTSRPTMKLELDPKVAAAAAQRRASYANTFQGRLRRYAKRMDMTLRIDWTAIRDEWPFYTSAFHRRTFVEPAVQGAAIDELKSFLEQNDTNLVPISITESSGEKSLFLTTHKHAAIFGPKPSLEEIRKLRPWGGVSEEINVEIGMVAMSEALKLPIAGSATEPKLVDALTLVSRRIGIAVVYDDDALSAEGISKDEIVMLDPRNREARAVIYELLRQADPLKLERVVYCFERTKSGDFQLLITTREAAQRAGRTIPFDLLMMNEDV